MKEKSLRLRYAKIGEVEDNDKARPCVVKPRGISPVTPFRVVPVVPINKNDCVGCVGERSNHYHEVNPITCNDLPDCTDAIYVRATPANKLKHIEWLLDEYNKQ